ncbi:MAG TPA: ribonuclease Y [Candidatus Saccharimonadales bacterium]|nr:ribonuclease Y [Candidatus Saccharimonadales bacterium]
MSLSAAILLAAAVAAAALLVDHFVRASIRRKRLAEGRVRAAAIIEKAERDARSRLEEAELEARLKVSEALDKAEKEIATRQESLEGSGRQMEARERNLQRKTQLYEERLAQVEARETSLAESESRAAESRSLLEKQVTEQRARLEQISGYTSAMAKNELMHEMEAEARREAALRIQRVEEEAHATAAEQARWVITQAMQQYRPPQVAESTVTVLDLPSDDMKARIIGREGRNIRTIEMSMGVDLIIDDTPGAIVLSSFNPVRRAIAKMALEKLVEDGRIHPARIEEVVAKIREDFERIVTEQGEAAALELGMHDLDPRLFKMVGQLGYMTFHGQSLLQHSQEVARLAVRIGSLLDIGVETAKRAGLLHKIGFAEEGSVEKSPQVASAEAAQRHGEPEPVVHCIQALYGLVAPRSMEAAILQVAERVSISRPGAQREMLQDYLERLGSLEKIAREFPGVREAYAMRAGREVRVMVEPGRIGDKEVVWLSRDIARKIEESVSYPGQVRVSVIRETRAIDFAM